MYKKLILLLVTVLLMTQVIGCGNGNDQESTEANESAVDTSTADSSDVDLEKLPELSSVDQTEDSVDITAVYEEADLLCVLPKGFVAYEGEEGVYVHKSYPGDTSTISYVISESDEDITQMTREEYKNLCEEDFLESYGDEATIEINSYESIRVDGRNGLKIKLEYELKGVDYEQLVYIIYNGTETHILNYTQEKDGGWMKEFEESGDSLSFKAR